MRRLRQVGGMALVLAAAIAGGAAFAQTSTFEIKEGEVVKVVGNDLVVKTAEGYRQVNVPDDFRFMTDGQDLSVHQLKPGMKLTAAIQTTRTPIVVTTTELVNAEVLNANGMSVVVKNQDGEQKIFTKEDFAGKGLAVYKDGQPANSFDFRKGDRITALIMKEGPPLVLEEKRIAAVAENPPPPPPKPVQSAPVVAKATPPPPPPPAQQKTLPKTASPWPLVGLAGLVLVGAGAAMTAVRRLRVG